MQAPVCRESVCRQVSKNNPEGRTDSGRRRELDSGPSPRLDGNETKRLMSGGLCKMKHLLQAFSSDPSAQSGSPLQNNSLLIQSPLPQASLPVSQIGSSVANKGATKRGSASNNESLRGKSIAHGQLTFQLLAILHIGLPIASLLVNVKS